jgi:hypothetical protein
MTMHAELLPICGQSRGARDEIAPTFYASRGGPRRAAEVGDRSPSTKVGPVDDTRGVSSEVVIEIGAGLPVNELLSN